MDNHLYSLLGMSMMFQTVYSPGMWQDLLRNIMQVAPVDRIALLHTRLDLASAGMVPSSDFLQLCLALQKDKNPLVLTELIHSFNSFCAVWLLAEARSGEKGGKSLAEMLRQFGDNLSSGVLEKIGDFPRAGEDEPTTTLRSMAIQRLALIEGFCDSYVGDFCFFEKNCFINRPSDECAVSFKAQ